MKQPVGALRRLDFVNRRRTARKNHAFGIEFEDVFERRIVRHDFTSRRGTHTLRAMGWAYWAPKSRTIMVFVGSRVHDYGLPDCGFVARAVLGRRFRIILARGANRAIVIAKQFVSLVHEGWR